MKSRLDEGAKCPDAECECPPSKSRRWITECVSAVKDCHEKGEKATRKLLQDAYEIFPSVANTCVRGGLLRDAEDGLVLTAKGLAFLEGECDG